jgi:phospholipid transport system substrate-binding protein
MKNLRSLMSFCLPVAALALTLAGPVRADPTPPDVLVRTTSEDVLRLVAEDKDLRNGNSSKLNDLIETRILPQFDMSKMTRLAVGKNWRQATQDQQKQLIKEFQTLLVRSYSAAYSAYRQVKVDVKPLKAIDGEDVTVKTQILLPGGAPPVAVDYAMNVTPDGWKVYNVVVEGVSLVTTYRTEFGAQIEQGGIDGLIRNLQERNSKAAQPPAPAKK